MPKSGSVSKSNPAKAPSAKKIAERIVEINPKFLPVIQAAGYCTLGAANSVSGNRKKESNFSSLASSILSQQLSTKAAATIINRVKQICDGNLNVEKLARLSNSQLRAAGCSEAKARAIRELALATKSNQLPMRSLHLRSDEDIMNTLLPLFGVGQWTVEMFLMFQLGRVDIWPVGDLGVRRGWERVHRLRTEISPQQLMKKGEIYAPYRSHLAWYCWRANEVL
jgi:DNA-3-methyladenine glycosylase II